MCVCVRVRVRVRVFELPCQLHNNHGWILTQMSLALDEPVLPDLAMTGEVTLTGRVLAIGGVKEKTIAARRSGCKVLIFPEPNRKDFNELDDATKEGLEVHYVTEYKQVFDIAFPNIKPESLDSEKLE